MLNNREKLQSENHGLYTQYYEEICTHIFFLCKNAEKKREMCAWFKGEQKSCVCTSIFWKNWLENKGYFSEKENLIGFSTYIYGEKYCLTCKTVWVQFKTVLRRQWKRHRKYDMLFTKEALKRGYDNEDERNLFAWTDDRSGHSFTMVLQIPVSATNGYIHLGTVWYCWSAYFWLALRHGSRRCWGLRWLTCSADMPIGHPYPHHQRVMGLLVGKIAHYTPAHYTLFRPAEKNFFGLRNRLWALWALWMIIGYYFGGAVLQKSFTVALTSIPENLVLGRAVQALWLVGYAFYKAKGTDYAL